MPAHRVTFGPVGDTGQDQEDQPPPAKSQPMRLNWPVPAALSQAGSVKTTAGEKWGKKFFRGCTPKVQMSKMGGDRLKIPQATVVSFLMQPRIKYGNYFWQERKRRRGRRPLEKNSSDRGMVSWSNRWAGKWFCPGTYPPNPSVGARWRLGKEKGVTDFSVTPWHASWWSWRESNPRPLECHASSPLK
ncbi:hypothetical protein DMR_01360 [Solidesulfovibrio magneticus RS-1]|uniref:Uncharacterized protein n=1 Tax=Solidesulfovibrio magneticus (strain ATCC 700980 / DSM 13731 / RS-1) TaxID=573370 RepID=C4XTW2_SOLM1|nr:hypothetical protein DMR_01360 [Solidesulfovibrio magneticus RS-1]